MVFVPQGSYNVGPSDQDVAWAQNTFSKTVTVDPFWMDETEITNNEYRQFVFWVSDSLFRELIAEVMEEEFKISVNEFDDPLEEDIFGRNYRLNWDTKLDLKRLKENEEVSRLWIICIIKLKNGFLAVKS